MNAPNHGGRCSARAATEARSYRQPTYKKALEFERRVRSQYTDDFREPTGCHPNARIAASRSARSPVQNPHTALHTASLRKNGRSIRKETGAAIQVVNPEAELAVRVTPQNVQRRCGRLNQDYWSAEIDVAFLMEPWWKDLRLTGCNAAAW